MALQGKLVSAGAGAGGLGGVGRLWACVGLGGGSCHGSHPGLGKEPSFPLQQPGGLPEDLASGTHTELVTV